MNIFSRVFFLPSATVVAGKLCFHWYLSVHRARCTPPGRQTPRSRQTPPWQADTPQAYTPGADNPLDRHPLGRYPPGETPPRDGYCSGRYASYWNTYLLTQYITHTLTHIKNILLIHGEKGHVLLENDHVDTEQKNNFSSYPKITFPTTWFSK